MENKKYKIKWGNVIYLIGLVLILAYTVTFVRHYVFEVERLNDEIEVIRMERELEYGEYQRAIRKADEMEYLHSKLLEEQQEMQITINELRDHNTELYEELEYYKTY